MKSGDSANRPEASMTPAGRPGHRMTRQVVTPLFDPFHTAKMSRPRTLRAQVHRPRLSVLLDAALQVPVTLVCAGAGWGKTVLVSTWAASKPFPCAWLTVDRSGNDVQSFWSSVMTAIRQIDGTVHGDPLTGLTSVPSDAGQRVRALARWLRRPSGPAVAIIDDFHEIDDSQVLRELGQLLDQPPAGFHVILLSRSDPGLPLHRWRLTGALSEIRAPDLAFTADEAARLLTRPHLDLDSADVAALLERTEGWPAGLQMAAAFLTGPGQPREIADFTGDVRSVDEYLAHEVLDRQPRRIVWFLLYTSVCEHVCGDLADALIDGSGGQQILEKLELVNDFVVRLGAKPHWFRYHHLLRDALRHHLLLWNPRMVPELHLRAARWHAAHGSILEALGHAAVARDWAYVGRLVVAEAAPLILSANRAALVNVVRSIPAAEVTSTAELMACDALQLFDAGDWDALSERLARARQLLPDGLDREHRPVEITLAALEMMMSLARGHMPAVVAQATRLLARLARMEVPEIRAAGRYRVLALHHKGVGLLWLGRTRTAEQFLWNASTAARASGMELVEISAVGHLALLEIMFGSVQEAVRLAGEVRDLAERRGWTHAPQSAAAHLALAQAHILRSELSPADLLLGQARQAGQHGRETTQHLMWLGSRAVLALARDEIDDARAILSEAGLYHRSRIQAPVLERWLLLIESQVDLSAGRTEAVEERYARLTRKASLTFAERVCRAQAAFATHDLHRAERLLAGPPEPLPATVTTVEARLLAALIADSRGHGLRAVDALAGALALAEREGLRRPFVSVGAEQVARLVARRSPATERYAAFAADVRKDAAGTGEGTTAPGATADLSARELEVLRYLPTMFTARDIAGELGVSVNTVKAHLRSIYRKLEVDRRRAAVDRARERSLL
ncbi:LuxR C-terminal-related transcriptional regulator [Jidongwangia harbinensis]|uniref:LuxR C-terminal-related transcriptional regulator n=1 Tax=Jidongwangia harbinensis TaxID=2878561 RepID=UPI001CDA2E7B|nr:LuxR C-terminal-related transcriptional regulator [Jidongwangia harbinensis]MCA2219093.1 LuxR C-terminal-related transcriptional regulator [Jidongwangia harbinensis]